MANYDMVGNGFEPMSDGEYRKWSALKDAKVAQYRKYANENEDHDLAEMDYNYADYISEMSVEEYREGVPDLSDEDRARIAAGEPHPLLVAFRAMKNKS